MEDRFKFRAWLKEEKRYSKWLNLFSCGENSRYEVEDYDEYGSHYTMYQANEVILEQCTGIKDKNGTLIYEGDIIKGKAIIGEGSFEYLGCIKWYYQSWLIGWYIEDKDGGAWELGQAHAKISDDNITGEVIGNIHTNPELMKG